MEAVRSCPLHFLACLVLLFLATTVEAFQGVHAGGGSGNSGGRAGKVEAVFVTNIVALEKVTLMLGEMKDKSVALKQEADAQHTATVDYCSSTLEEKQQQITALETQITNGEANVQTLEVNVEQGGQQFFERQGDLELHTYQLNEAAQQKTAQHKQFDEELASVNAGINAALQARLIVQSAPSGALEGQPGGSAFLSYTPDGGGMAKDETLFDDFKDVSSRRESFSSDSTTIVGVVDMVLEQLNQRKEALLLAKQSALTEHGNTATNLEQSIKTDHGAINLAQQEVAGHKTSLIATRQDLADAQESLSTETAFRQKLDQECKVKEAAHKEMDELRTAEIVALTNALQIIVKQFPSDQQQSGLLAEASAVTKGSLAGSSTLPGASAVPGERKVLGFLRLQGQRLASASLNGLAGELQAMMTADEPVDSDALAKVRLMIQELITKMQNQAAEEISHKNWCETEITKVENLKEESSSDIEKFKAKQQQLEASIAKLDLEITTVNATLEASDADKAKLIQQREADKATNNETLQDAEESSAALEAALQLLKDYYKNASEHLALIEDRAIDAAPVKHRLPAKSPSKENKDKATHKTGMLLASKGAEIMSNSTPSNESTPPTELPEVAGPQLGASQGVVAMLETCRDQYHTIVAETKKKEEEAEKLHSEALTDHEIMVVTAGKDQTFKMQQKAAAQTGLQETTEDLRGAELTLSDAHVQHDRLKAPCMQESTSAEKQAKRQEEITALEEAYKMIEEYGSQLSLVQQPQASAPALAPPAAAGKSVPPSIKAASAAQQVQGSVSIAARNATSARGHLSADRHTATDRRSMKVVSLHAAARTSSKQTIYEAGDNDSLAMVTDLLTEMHTEVQASYQDDQSVNQNLTTWCETTLASDQDSLASANDRESQLMTAIETSTQTKAQVETELEQLKKELATAGNSLNQQAEIRRADMERFHKHELELIQSVSALRNALHVLRERYNNTGEQEDLAAERAQLEAYKESAGESGGTDEGVPQQSLVSVVAEAKMALETLPSEDAAVVTSMSSEDSSVFQRFLTNPQDALIGTGSLLRRASLTEMGSRVSETPVDGMQIFGILQTLHETFKADLQALRDRETTENSTYFELKDSKSTQVQALQGNIDSKTAQLAQASTTNAQAKEDIVMVRESRRADVNHLMSTKSYCIEMASEFKTRKAARESEIAALAQAITVLNAEATPAPAPPAQQGAGNFFHAWPVAALHSVAAMHRPSATAKQVHRHLAPKHHEPPPKPENVVDAFLRSRLPAALSGMNFIGPHSTAPPQINGGSSVQRLSMVFQTPFNFPIIPAPGRVSAKSSLLSTIQAARSGTMPARGPNHNRLTALAMRTNTSSKDTESPGAAEKAGQSTYAEQQKEALKPITQAIYVVRVHLMQEQEQEAVQRKVCVEEKHEAEVHLGHRKHDKESAESEILRFSSLANQSGTQIEDLAGEVNNLNTSLETGPGIDFEAQIAEQRALQVKLHTAMQSLKAHYHASQSGLLQAPPATKPRVPLKLADKPRNVSSLEAPRKLSSLAAEFAAKTSTSRAAPAEAPAFSKPLHAHQGGNAVISILQLLIDNSGTLEKQLVQAKANAENAQATNLAETRQAIKDKDQEIVVLQAAKSDSEVSLQETQTRKQQAETQISEVEAFLQIVNKKCDVVLNTFVESQKARKAQIDNLEHAWHALLGMVA